MDTGYCGRQIVGIDLHRRRSVISRMTEDGAPLGTVRIDNDPFTLAEQMTAWGEAPLPSWTPRMAGTGPQTCWPSTAR